jgi:hypothetical protein
MVGPTGFPPPNRIQEIVKDLKSKTADSQKDKDQQQNAYSGSKRKSGYQQDDKQKKERDIYSRQEIELALSELQDHLKGEGLHVESDPIEPSLTKDSEAQIEIKDDSGKVVQKLSAFDFMRKNIRNIHQQTEGHRKGSLLDRSY